MRTYLLPYILAGLLAGLLAVLAGPLAATASPTREAEAEAGSSGAQRIAVEFQGLRDEAAMVLVGTVLIGLAAAVRRAA